MATGVCFLWLLRLFFMATAKKLPSGSWRIQVSATGADSISIRKSFTAPTKKEAEFLASCFLLDVKQRKKEQSAVRITLDESMKKWIDNRRNTLSPATIRMYDSMHRCAYAPLLHRRIITIDAEDVQSCINEYGATHSPKSVRNAYALLHSVLSAYAPNLDLSKTVLPQKRVAEMTIQESRDISALLAYTRDHDEELYLAILLCSTLGLRRSELCALTPQDFKDGKCHINKALVLSYDNKSHVIKPPKTISGTRSLDVDPQILEAVLAHAPNPITGRIFTSTPESISNRYRTLKKNLNIPGRFHDLRHPYVKHTTKKYNSEKQKTQATKIDLIAWVFRFCTFNYSKRSWIL